MRVSRHGFLPLSPVGPVQAAFCVALLVAYLALAGDAIRCQYASAAHAHHGLPQSQGEADATHCLMANHGSATIPTIAPLGFQSFHVVGQILAGDYHVSPEAFVASTPARAPPLG